MTRTDILIAADDFDDVGFFHDPYALDPEIALLADQAFAWIYNLAAAAFYMGHRVTDAIAMHRRAVEDQGRRFRHAARRDGMPLVGKAVA